VHNQIYYIKCMFILMARRSKLMTSAKFPLFPSYQPHLKGNLNHSSKQSSYPTHKGNLYSPLRLNPNTTSTLQGILLPKGDLYPTTKDNLLPHPPIMEIYTLPLPWKQSILNVPTGCTLRKQISIRIEKPFLDMRPVIFYRPRH